MKVEERKRFTLSLSEKEAVALWRWMNIRAETSKSDEAYALWEKLDNQFRGKVLP